MGTWLAMEPRGIAQAIQAVSSVQLHPLGDEIQAQDVSATAQGPGRFVYLLGVASTIEGALVSYNATTYQTTLAPNTANLNTPLAVAMAAVLANQFGWYQVIGLARI